MKKTYAPLLLVGFFALVGAGCAGTTYNSATVTPPSPGAEATGRAVFTIQDAAAGLNNVTAVNVTVDKVEAHAAASGWMTVSTAAKTYDLVQLKSTGAAQLLADVNLAPGVYDQVRLDISKVEVTASGTTKVAKLPSSTLKIIGQFTVVAGQSTTISLDFILDKSLHLTGTGLYILAPVVKLQTTTNASVRVEADESVNASGGEIETDESVGMDEKGETKPDFELPNKLKIDARGLIEIDGQ